MMLQFFSADLGLVCQSAFGTKGALSPSAGGNRSLPSGLSGADCSASAGAVLPMRSITEVPDAFSAAMIVSEIEVMMNAVARWWHGASVSNRLAVGPGILALHGPNRLVQRG